MTLQAHRQPGCSLTLLFPETALTSSPVKVVINAEVFWPGTGVWFWSGASRVVRTGRTRKGMQGYPRQAQGDTF